MPVRLSRGCGQVSISTAVALFFGLVCGIIFVRSRTSSTVSPHDRRVFEERYRKRGLKLVAMRRIGTEWSSFFSRRQHPIRKYEIDTEDPSGRRETRIRGISRGDLSGDMIWRFDRNGSAKERLH